MNINNICIVDNGRGKQLSTSRITVLDLIPYFQRGCNYDEIRHWIPSLSEEEIAVVERYYRENQVEMDELDRRATAYREEQIRLQRIRFPEPNESLEDQIARMRKMLRNRQTAD